MNCNKRTQKFAYFLLNTISAGSCNKHGKHILGVPHNYSPPLQLGYCEIIQPAFLPFSKSTVHQNTAPNAIERSGSANQ